MANAVRPTANGFTNHRLCQDTCSVLETIAVSRIRLNAIKKRALKKQYSAIAWSDVFAAEKELHKKIQGLKHRSEKLLEEIVDWQDKVLALEEKKGALFEKRLELEEELAHWYTRVIPAIPLKPKLAGGAMGTPWRTKSDEIEAQVTTIDQQIIQSDDRQELIEDNLSRSRARLARLERSVRECQIHCEVIEERIQLLKQLHDGTNYTPSTAKPPGQSVDAPVQSVLDNRDPRLYDAVIDQYGVSSNPRYRQNRKGQGETYCNIFVWDVTRSMGAEIPHWVDANGDSVDVGRGRELDANESIRWLERHGQSHGWSVVSAEKAQSLANQGYPVVATFYNPDTEGIGHVAMVRPSEFFTQYGPAIAQAGASNFNVGSVKQGFGDRNVVYYYHE